MNVDFAVHLLSQALLNATIICAPMLGLILVVGLLVNIGQVVTQLQEMTLSFIPKLVGLVILLTLAGPWMMGRITAFALSMYQAIAGVR